MSDRNTARRERIAVLATGSSVTERRRPGPFVGPRTHIDEAWKERVRATLRARGMRQSDLVREIAKSGTITTDAAISLLLSRGRSSNLVALVESALGLEGIPRISPSVAALPAPQVSAPDLSEHWRDLIHSQATHIKRLEQRIAELEARK